MQESLNEECIYCLTMSAASEAESDSIRQLFFLLFSPLTFALFFSCTWLKVEKIVIKLVLRVNGLAAVGTADWMVCFTPIKKQK